MLSFRNKLIVLFGVLLVSVGLGILCHQTGAFFYPPPGPLP